MISKITSGRLYSALIIVITFAACTHNDDYKTIRQQVINMHDQVMFDDETVTNNKMLLDTIAQIPYKRIPGYNSLDTAAIRDKVKALMGKTDSISSQMDKWMQAFDADVQGKSNDEAVAYFKGQLRGVERLDSAYKALIHQAGDFFTRYHVKSQQAEKKGQRMKM